MKKIILNLVVGLYSIQLFANVVINELNYNPDGGDDLTEFIELWNFGSQTIDISGWYFSNGIDFVFDKGDSLEAGEFLIVARYTNEFPNSYGPFANDTKLSNGGELVSLCDSNGTVICSFTYDDKSPWPEKADGDGLSLELKQPLLPVTDSTSWAESLILGGTPRATNSTYFGAAAVIPHETIPPNPLNGEEVSVIAEVFAPSSVAYLKLFYSTNQETEIVVTMYDDGAHDDSAAGDSIYGGTVPSMPNATYVWYYFKLKLADGTIQDFPPEKEVESFGPGMTARLSYSGLYTDVLPKSEWQVVTNIGVATSSKLYIYLNGEGEVLIDDVSISYGGTEYIVNGDFTINDSGWAKTGNHSGTDHESTFGYSSPGCERIVSTGVGGGSDNSLNCNTSPDLQEDSTNYTFSFAYRSDPEYERTWNSYYVGYTNWNALCINEFMSWNSSFITDENGDYSDWIEIYNNGSEPFNLYGYGLSDDSAYLNKWVFPDYVLDPKSYLIVFASGKNRKGSEFHTNFKIKSEGEPIFLSTKNSPFEGGLRGMSIVDETPSVFIPEDKSFGCRLNGGTNLVYFETPTPESSNGGTTYSSVAEEPQFSRSGGFFSGSLSLTLSVVSASAKIYYTTDGTTPTESSILYTDSGNLYSTTLVKARVFDDDSLPGKVVSHKYYSGLPAGELTSSTLPIIVLDSLGGTIVDEPKIPGRMGIIWNQNGETNFVTDQFNDYDGMIGIEIRGKSSTWFDKKQYGIEARNDDDEQIEVSLLGLPAESDWVLNGPFSDKSLMRNAIAYYTERQMVEYAPRTKFCEVILTGSYNGVYLLIEKLSRSKNRIDIKKLAPYQNTEPEISGGYILKVDKSDGGDTISDTDGGVKIIHVYPKGTELTSAQQNWILNYLNEFENAILSADSSEVIAAAEAFVDVDSFVNNYVHVQFTKNIDGLRLSAYMYKDKNKKLVMGPQWDYNLSFGNANYFDGQYSSGWYDQDDGYAIPFWWDEFLSDTNFVKLCALRWIELRKNLFATSNLLELVDSNVELLGEAAERNFTRWNILGTYVWPNASGYARRNTYAKEITWMKQWIEGRVDWMDGADGWDIVTADFTADKFYAEIGDSIQFQSTGLRTPDNYSWNFGDAEGWQSNASSPTNIYNFPGIYNVTLKVDKNSSAAGLISDTTMKTNYIQVVPEPGILFSIQFSIFSFFIFFNYRKK